MTQSVCEVADAVLGLTVSQNGSASSSLGLSLTSGMCSLSQWFQMQVVSLSCFAWFGFGLWLSCVLGWVFLGSSIAVQSVFVHPCRTLVSVRRHCRWPWIMTVLLALNCRVGEAAVPGPGPTLRLQEA